MGYIYKITNLIEHKIYVGQTKNLKRRMKEYKNKSKKLDKRSSYKMMKIINQYGFENFKFDILEEVINNENLNEREIFWIDKLNSRNPDIGYNSKTGGLGGLLIDESKKLMSESSKGFRHSDEEKLRRSKPIFVIKDNKKIPFISAKLYADGIGRTRSEVTAAINRGIKIGGAYIFYQDNDERKTCVKKIIDKKISKNKVCRRSLSEYLNIYRLNFNDLDI